MTSRRVYIQVRPGGRIKANSDYLAALRVNFDVPDKHWALADRYIAGYSTAPEIIRADAEGNGTYWFRVR